MKVVVVSGCYDFGSRPFIEAVEVLVACIYVASDALQLLGLAISAEMTATTLLDK